MAFKQPRSVQVVVFGEAADRHVYLLLKRVESQGGFWQSVTGSLEEGENHLEAAVREIREETGLVINQDDLISLNLTNSFEIAPQWRGLYGPGVTHNEEVCFAMKADRKEVKLDLLEHDEAIWAEYRTAMDLMHWESSKRALAATESLLEDFHCRGAGDEADP